MKFTSKMDFCIYIPRHVPLPLREKVKQELDCMESSSVKKISKPTQWCVGIVVVPKKEGKIHICVDLKPFNEKVLREIHPNEKVFREIHPLPRVEDILAQITGAKIFTKIGC